MRVPHLLLFVAFPGAVLSAELAPEIEPLAAKFKTESAAVEADREAMIGRLASDYQSALENAEKAATTSRDVKALSAIATEMSGVKSGKLKTEAPADLPKSVQRERKEYLGGIARTDANIAARRQRVRADYLRDLAMLQKNSATKPELIAQITAEKERLVRTR